MHPRILSSSIFAPLGILIFTPLYSITRDIAGEFHAVSTLQKVATFRHYRYQYTVSTTGDGAGVGAGSTAFTGGSLGAGSLGASLTGTGSSPLPFLFTAASISF